MNQIKKMAEAYAQEKSCSDEHCHGLEMGFIFGFKFAREWAAKEVLEFDGDARQAEFIAKPWDEQA